MPDERAFIFVRAESPLHVGGGTSLGVVDNPILRESVTQFPFIPGSAVKGTLRSWWRNYQQDKEKEKNIFGPEKSGDKDESAGEVVFGDASLLLLPIRSYKGVYALATCPLLLARAQRLGLLSEQGVISPAQGKCKAASLDLAVEGNKAVFEEFYFELEKDEHLKKIADLLAKQLGLEGFFGERLQKGLVVLADDDFSYFARRGTEVQAHVRIDPQTKTVATGALWYTEYLPAESVLYFTLAPRLAQRKEAKEAFELLKEKMKTTFPLQLGGNETTGKGQCLLTWSQGVGEVQHAK